MRILEVEFYEKFGKVRASVTYQEWLCQPKITTLIHLPPENTSNPELYWFTAKGNDVNIDLAKELSNRLREQINAKGSC